MKKPLLAILAAGLCSALPCVAATELDASLVGKGGSLTALPSLADVSALVVEVRDLSMKYAALTSAVAYIERKCETDANWRKAYHQGVAAQSLATNEYGIAYRVTIYNDGFVFADHPRVVPRPASPEDAARAEAASKALVAAKREEMIAAMERANLPEKVAEILAARRAAAVTNETTVVIRP